MDLITMGDFAITNHGGNTVVSFRMPSQESIDFNFNDETTLEQTISPKLDFSKTSQNAVCPCGSGKKFKRCHGKKS
jgi:uncharacterized protein YchJ